MASVMLMPSDNTGNIDWIEHIQREERSWTLQLFATRSKGERGKRPPPAYVRLLFLLVVANGFEGSMTYPVEQTPQTKRLRIPQRPPTPFDRSNISSIKYLSLNRVAEPSLRTTATPENETPNDADDKDAPLSVQEIVDVAVSKLKKKFMKRITRLEDIVSRQEIELYRLKQQCSQLSDVTEAFTSLLDLLKEAGLDAETLSIQGRSPTSQRRSEENPTRELPPVSKESKNKGQGPAKIVESYDDEIIFGSAPSSVIDAADAAGAAILAAMLGGKQRMLVDVRDAELSSDPETLVQFIELAILPIAAGLEGLKSTRNRVKIVFPKVSQLLEYRRTMALAAPEVVALSTLGFDPVERRDKLVVIVAPEPDDDEGIKAMKELLEPSVDTVQPIQQPVVVLNYHMIPFQGLDLHFETAYHLRLLTVQFMSDGIAEEFLEKYKSENSETSPALTDESERREQDIGSDRGQEVEEEQTDDEALESAMRHAHELGVHQGTTRAMVIRAYPRPWHVFVDLSPNTDADYEVAATFDEEPSLDQINFAIVECLEGSEAEDEIVAQQMQQALEEGQLNQISDMIGDVLEKLDYGTDATNVSDEEDDFDMFEEDSV
jgi:hypothetical protein